MEHARAQGWIRGHIMNGSAFGRMLEMLTVFISVDKMATVLAEYYDDRVKAEYKAAQDRILAEAGEFHSDATGTF